MGCLWLVLLSTSFLLSIDPASSDGVDADDVGPNVTVTTSLGDVMGSTIKPWVVDYYSQKHGREVKPLYQFLGVPYATPPLGKLRFKKPKPVEKWSPKVIEAFGFGPDCRQPARINRQQTTFRDYYSEDCLNLNIWTPSLPPAKDEASQTYTPKPVFFFVHGGAFTIGAPSMSAMHPHLLAMSQDVVVVSIAYRLGFFGYLVSPEDVTDPDLIAPGNAGLHDVLMALEWVQEHVKHFGGDPKQVTIAGQSVGSMLVSSIFSSPTVPKNLFTAAMFMSGSSALLPSGYNNRSAEVPKARHLALLLNCPIEDSNKMMECLTTGTDFNEKILKSEEVVKTFPYTETIGLASMLFVPIIGDDLLPHDVYSLINSEDVKKIRSKTRVMVGTVNWEGGIMDSAKETSVLVKKINNTIDPENQKVDYVQAIVDYLTGDYKVSVEQAESIGDHYVNLDMGSDKLTNIFTLIGDVSFTCPSYFTALSISSYAKSVYSYIFSYKEGLIPHGGDSMYILGTILVKGGAMSDFFGEDDYEQCIQAMDMVGAFVRNEKVTFKSGQEDVEWKQFEPKSRTSLEMNFFKGYQLHNDFYGQECELLGKQVLKYGLKA